MKLYNLKDHNEQVSFAQAVKQGLGSQQGLFFPLELPEFELTDIDAMLEMDFVSRSSKILSAYIGDEIAAHQLAERVKNAFAFPAPVAKVSADVACLELFHGPRWHSKTSVAVSWRRCSLMCQALMSKSPF